MNPLVQVSWGELFDKIVILEIKTQRLSSASARANAGRELAILLDAAKTAAASPALADLRGKLKTVNEALWGIEDDIRAKEAASDFGEGFVELARAVYHRNDERGRIKRDINALLGSGLVEEKEYTSY